MTSFHSDHQTPKPSLSYEALTPPTEGVEAALANVTKDLKGLFEGTDASAFAALIDAYRAASAKKQ